MPFSFPPPKKPPTASSTKLHFNNPQLNKSYLLPRWSLRKDAQKILRSEELANEHSVINIASSATCLETNPSLTCRNTNFRLFLYCQNVMNTWRLILAGGTGFLGQLLAKYFSGRGWDCVVLTRNPDAKLSHGKPVVWDGKALGLWAAELDGADAVINLAGRTVNCRYTKANRQTILDSRVDSTRVIGQAIANCKIPPPIWLNSSTATIYKHTFGAPWDENGVIGATKAAQDEFSIEVARAWEAEFNNAVTPQTRKIILRSAMVLGHGENSVFPVLRRLARLGLGGRMGSGRQYVSWIHQEDFCRAIEFLIESRHEPRTQNQAPAIYNLAAPTPVTNSEMMLVLRRAVGAHFGLPASAWMLELGAFLLRTETELIIKSRRVIPARLVKEGFKFNFQTIEEAFQELNTNPSSSITVAQASPKLEY